MAGVSDLEVRQGLLTCQLEGEPTALVAALQGCRLDDLLIEPARLEEAFLEYYAEAPPDDDEPERGPGPRAVGDAGGPDADPAAGAR